MGVLCGSVTEEQKNAEKNPVVWQRKKTPGSGNTLQAGIQD